MPKYLRSHDGCIETYHVFKDLLIFVLNRPLRVLWTLLLLFFLFFFWQRSIFKVFSVASGSAERLWEELKMLSHVRSLIGIPEVSQSGAMT